MPHLLHTLHTSSYYSASTTTASSSSFAWAAIKSYISTSTLARSWNFLTTSTAPSPSTLVRRGGDGSAIPAAALIGIIIGSLLACGAIVCWAMGSHRKENARRRATGRRAGYERRRPRARRMEHDGWYANGRPENGRSYMGGGGHSGRSRIPDEEYAYGDGGYPDAGRYEMQERGIPMAPPPSYKTSRHGGYRSEHPRQFGAPLEAEYSGRC